jgi:hypothetical protein
MSPSLQTAIALIIVVLAAVYLIRTMLKKRRSPGCGDGCGAVSPDVKKLQARLKP